MLKMLTLSHIFFHLNKFIMASHRRLPVYCSVRQMIVQCVFNRRRITWINELQYESR